jgi:hypothetical protein
MPIFVNVSGMPKEWSNTDRLKAAAQMWKDLSSAEQDHYNARAKQCPKLEPSSLTGSQAQFYIRKQEAQLAKLV